MKQTPPGFRFEILHQSAENHARVGRLETPHGGIDTPAFIFCATKAAIKAASPASMKKAGTQIILSNTYHLMLRPGEDIIAKFGGLHRFTGWDGPMLTDSGGFQIFSLQHGGVADEIKGSRKHKADTITSAVKLTEEGAEFRSHIDGTKYFLTPERSVQIQRRLGPDIILPLDECTPYHADRRYTEKSLELSLRWSDRSLAEFQRQDEAYPPMHGSSGAQAMYGISQGGVFDDLRARATDYLLDRPFFGYAIGGSLGASKDQMYDVVGNAMAGLDRAKPVHLLGIGGIQDIFECVPFGIDTFDCVAPTRMARHGAALVPAAQAPDRTRAEPRLNLKNAGFATDAKPIDPDCACEACATFSRGYIHHLVRSGEILGQMLLTLHNVATLNRVMADIRKGLAEGSLAPARVYWLGT